MPEGCQGGKAAPGGGSEAHKERIGMAQLGGHAEAQVERFRQAQGVWQGSGRAWCRWPRRHGVGRCE